ncbi:uncharacterized protein KIAA1958-like [Clytia hemisphaerica]|uniref:uncharacterized protein KIAA1958-like n=1 Tax=Clytia hemisphaerica TaxID=252671 RepID=UPI0034D7B80D
MNRFDSCNNDNIQQFIDKSKNQNTTKATSLSKRTYDAWANERNQTKDNELLNPVDLDSLLQRFFAEIKKQNGKDYEPGSLASLQSGIDRYLREKRYQYSIMNDIEFSSSRAVLEGKARLLREQGMGKRPNKAASLTKAEEEILWECGQLGTESPSSLINTIWWQFSMHFGLRGRQEHHIMKVEDFTWKLDEDGNEFLTFSESFSKTRQNGLREVHRVAQPKMFANGSSRCPLMIYKTYLSKRPLSLRHSGPLYLSINHKTTTNVWFKNQKMGQNTIDTIMKRMVESSTLSTTTTKKLSNHTVRKTGIKRMKANSIPRSEIITVTGHKSEAGLDPYDSGDEVEQRRISHAIDNVPCSSRSNPHQNWVVPANNHSVQNPTFSFFDQHQQVLCPRTSAFNFSNCTVNFYNQSQAQTPSKAPCSPPRPKKRRYIIYSDSDSSQEN